MAPQGGAMFMAQIRLAMVKSKSTILIDLFNMSPTFKTPPIVNKCFPLSGVSVNWVKVCVEPVIRSIHRPEQCILHYPQLGAAALNLA